MKESMLVKNANNNEENVAFTIDSRAIEHEAGAYRRTRRRGELG